MPPRLPSSLRQPPRANPSTTEVPHEIHLRFSPDLVEVRQGETLKFPGMEHDEPYMAHVAAGKAGQLVWTFNRAGEFDFSCLIAGHYQAGMTGKIRVAPDTRVSGASAAPEGYTEAEVRKVDRETGKITLRHGEIKSLDMPAMTMVFQVADAAVLERLMPGDRVRFKAAREGGKFTVTEIQPLN